MSAAAETPVLVGVGQILQRQDDPVAADEPLAMMVAALRQAGDDAEAPSLLERADALYVVRGAWGYGNPGRVVAERLGAKPSAIVGTPYGGNFSQACVIDAARAIHAGRRRVVLVTGAENGRTTGQAQRQGVTPPTTDAPGLPDRELAENKPLFHEAEIACGMNSASDIYALIESRLRYVGGESLEAHQARIAALWAGFNEVAQGNPNAWIREAVSAERIGTAGPDNPMISFPYPRLMNANARVDMGAGLLLCSLEAAREAGVPEPRIVYLHAATEANDPNFLSEREEFDRSPGMRLAGARAFELAGTAPESIDHVDLYSCFPSSVQIAAREMGLGEDRPLTVTGGLTFGGGPLNDYVLHAIARMAEVAREAPGSLGLVSANGGWLAKHAMAIYGTAPPEQGFRYENLQAEVDAFPTREALVTWAGPVTTEACTVAHQRGVPTRALLACLTDEGCRTWATLDDADTMQAMMREEFCGRAATLDGRGGIRFR